MDKVEVASLRAIEDELTRTVVTNLGIELDTLFYDTTNFISTKLRFCSRCQADLEEERAGPRFLDRAISDEAALNSQS
jgi:hypothetical protein